MPANILIVEDQSIIARDLKTRLMQLDYQVSAIVASGEEAIECVQVLPSDLVLIDIQLKGMLDGIETATRLRALTQVPIVYITAHSDELTLERATATEPHAYVLKPFDDTELRSAIEIALYRHRTERQLRQSEARFRSLIKHTNEVILVVDATGNLTYASPTAQRLVGDLTAHPLAEVVTDFVAPEDVAAVYSALRQVQARPEAQASIAECRIRLHDGDWHTFAAVATNLLDDPTVNGIVINAHDVTEQKQAAQRLDQLFMAAQRHARELAALNTAFRAMSSSLELKSVLKAVTGELQRLIGSESVSVLLHEGDELVFAAASGPGADALIGTRMPATAGIAGAVLKSKTPTLSTHAPTDQRFYSAIDAKTGLATQTILAVPLVLGDRAIGVMEAINKNRDLSQLQTGVDSFDGHDFDLMVAIASSAAIAIENARLYETLRDHHQRMQAAQPRLIQIEKMAALGRLTASLTHEINNPLQAVQGSLDLIAEALDDLVAPGAGEIRSAVQPHMTIALSEVQRMAQLVRRLRDYYQANRSAAAAVDVSVVIDQVLDLTAESLAGHQISVERAGGYRAVQLTVNPDRLRQLLLNLVLNAIDVMARGGTLRLELSPCVRHAVAGLRIAIGDTGPVIPAALLPAVFEPFQAVRANDSSLGLSICYELALSLGGEITVTSEPAAGTTFAVWLPGLMEEIDL